MIFFTATACPVSWSFAELRPLVFQSRSCSMFAMLTRPARMLPYPQAAGQCTYAISVLSLAVPVCQARAIPGGYLEGRAENLGSYEFRHVVGGILRFAGSNAAWTKAAEMVVRWLFLGCWLVCVIGKLLKERSPHQSRRRGRHSREVNSLSSLNAIFQSTRFKWWLLVLEGGLNRTDWIAE